MSDLELIGWPVVGLLSCLLLFLRVRRHRQEAAEEVWDSTCTSTAFDATELRKRLGRLRTDYGLPRYPHPQQAQYHRNLLAHAREALARLGFFQHKLQ